MKQNTIEELGERLVRRFGTRDPFAIAQGLGIAVYRENFGRLKGMYRVIHRRRCLFVNKHLDEMTARIVCAHEIGHDQLHRDAAKDQGLPELMLYNMTSRMEYEANMVAAAILLSDEDVLECIYQYHYDAAQTAHLCLLGIEFEKRLQLFCCHVGAKLSAQLIHICDQLLDAWGVGTLILLWCDVSNPKSM